MSKKYKSVLITLAVFFTVAVILLGIVGNYFYNYALNRFATKTIFSKDEEERQMTSGVVEDTDKAWLLSNAEDFSLYTEEGLSLHAYRVKNDGHKYAIVIHGYRSKATEMASYAKHFYDNGMNIVAPDLRGHGKSDGDYIGMGWTDHLDIIGWINHILYEDPVAEIVLFGVSMGAAAVMMASGEELPSQVKCIIEDCGYTSVWDEFSVQLKAEFNLPTFPVLHASSFITQIRAGYSLKEASAIKQVAKSMTPILFIHGDADTFVPFSMLEPLYEAANCEKEKMVITEAEHAKSSVTNPTTYWSGIFSFIEKYIEK